MLTLGELREKLLVRYDADDLLEVLQISAQELLERFEDKIEIHVEKLVEAVDELDG